MALDLTPEQKETGRQNFQRVVGKLAEDDRTTAAAAPGGMTRRRFMQGLLAGAAVAPVSAAAYYGYNNSSFRQRPVKAGLIGAGDEGGVLAGEHNPAFLEFIAYSEIRPTNQERIFRGEPSGPRRGFNFHYGNDCRQRIRLYEDYRELLRNPEIEMVVIALPLHLHAQATIEALDAGKHVLCEKLMAWNIRQCKDMIKKAEDTGKLLSIGHQRHYSLLYAHALEVMQTGVLGDVKHIRALWHRNNTLLDDNRRIRDSWNPVINPLDAQAVGSRVRQFGYRSMEELVRWRLYRRTGGGLMAELGSHQLDACSIFQEKRLPLAVTAVGGKHFYTDNREVEDHVYCIYEFPGKNYDRTKGPNDPNNDIVVVTYSSINTNGFEPYGECIMGSRGTLIVEQEQSAYLFGGAGRGTSVTASTTGGGPVLAASGSTDPGDRRAAEVGGGALAALPSRGYREEMEHLAYLIRTRDEATDADRARLKPRCDGRQAMADAIVALTANAAMSDPVQKRIVFHEDWFDPTKEAVPPVNLRVETV